MNGLQDEESFVRATAYAVLSLSVSLEGRSTWEVYFDYHSLLEVSGFCFELVFIHFRQFLILNLLRKQTRGFEMKLREMFVRK